MAATKISIVVVVVVTTLHHRHLHHILSPFHAHCTHPRSPNGWQPLRPPSSVVTLSRGRCEPALIATPDVAAVVDAVVVAVASAAAVAALRRHPHRPPLFAVVVVVVAVAVNRHATQPSPIYLVAHLPVVI